MEKLGVEPRTFSTQHVLLSTMLRRCHTARPYPLTKSLLISEADSRSANYVHSNKHGLSRSTPITLKRAIQRPPSTHRLEQSHPDRPRPTPPTASCYSATMARVLNSLLVLLFCVVLGYAHNIQLRAHSRECFHEMLHADDRMTVTFQVGDREFGGSGNLDLDFWVSGIACNAKGKGIGRGIKTRRGRTLGGYRERLVLNRMARCVGLHQAMLAVLKESVR
jgi:hypothetical protein